MSNDQWKMTKARVIIYSRPGCHLCDEAKAAIEKSNCADHYTLEEVNIESDNELLKKYQYDIPVITIDGVEAFKHRIDPEQFKIRVTQSEAPR